MKTPESQVAAIDRRIGKLLEQQTEARRARSDYILALGDSEPTKAQATELATLDAEINACETRIQALRDARAAAVAVDEATFWRRVEQEEHDAARAAVHAGEEKREAAGKLDEALAAVAAAMTEYNAAASRQGQATNAAVRRHVHVDNRPHAARIDVELIGVRLVHLAAGKPQASLSFADRAALEAGRLAAYFSRVLDKPKPAEGVQGPPPVRKPVRHDTKPADAAAVAKRKVETAEGLLR